MSIRPGVRLGERYQLLSPIATGGMGQVWRAEDTTLHRIVAAKILRSEFSGDEKFVARFRAEARNTAALSHPNIASVFDYGEQVQDAEQLAYLVMELVEGEPLVDILLRERRLSPNRTLDYLEQTAMGLAAAHRAGMVHRDVKPGNLIIRPDGVLKITDFGIARAANAVALTEQGTVVGTAQYLAPEQAEGKAARPASDIYALGVVGYECLAGFRPFDGDNSVAIALSQIRDRPRPLPGDVPQHVRTLIELTMAKNPAARYRDGTAFVSAVREVRAGRSPRPPVHQAPPRRPPYQLPGQPAPGVAPAPAPGPSAPLPSPAGPPPHPPAAGFASPAASSGTGTHNALPAPTGAPAVAVPAATGTVEPTRGATSRRWWWAALIAALLVIALIITLVLVNQDEETTGSAGNDAMAPTTVSDTAPSREPEPPLIADSGFRMGDDVVDLDQDYYVGKQVQLIVDELRALDMDLVIVTVDDGYTLGPGEVEAIDPSYNIRRGDQVVVFYVPDPSGAPPT